MNGSSNTKKHLKSLDLSIVLRKPVIRKIVESVSLFSGSRGQDAGYGNGFFTLMLAEAAGTSGQVIGLDKKEEFLKKRSAGFGFRLQLKDQFYFPGQRVWDAGLGGGSGDFTLRLLNQRDY